MLGMYMHAWHTHELRACPSPLTCSGGDAGCQQTWRGPMGELSRVCAGGTTQGDAVEEKRSF